MKQVQVTPEVIAQWQEDTTARLAAGWKVATVRGQLARSGCPPELIDGMLRKAQGGVRQGNRRAGRTAIGVGVALVVIGLGIVLVQMLLAGATGMRMVAVPIGLIGIGLLSILTGVLKAIHG